MPHDETIWHQPNTAVYTRYHGELSINDIKEVMGNIGTFYEASDAIHIHQIVDVRDVTQAKVEELAAYLTMPEHIKFMEQHGERLGWRLYIGRKEDKFFQMSFALMAQKNSYRMRTFETLEEVEQFLAEEG